MLKKEKEILRKAVDHDDGLLKPVDLINVIAKQDRRSVENLVARKYLEEVPRDYPGIKGGFYAVNFYRVTEKGLLIFAPWCQKLWYWVKGDVRTVVITIISAVLTTLVTIFIQSLFN